MSTATRSPERLIVNSHSDLIQALSVKLQVHRTLNNPTSFPSCFSPRKLFQHGEQLCSKANTLTNASAQCAVDVLALDAKVKWISEAVIEQLKLAASVAKSIEHKRAQLDKQTREWDTIRSHRTTALDTILEALGAQLVPPDFHQTSSDSSLFGSQHSLDRPNGTYRPQPESLRNCPGKPFHRTKWKTLRDFVDESAIEEVLDAVESDRTRLDDIMSTTYDYPETLSTAENTTADLAKHLESLASHYDQMVSALHDSEAGISPTEEEMQAMKRDTDELPSIMAELEHDVNSIQEAHEKLLLARTAAQEQLDTSRSTLDNLEELGDIMSDMLQKQQEVETDCEDLLEGLQQRLLSSFNKLLSEIARRRQYCEAAVKIVEGMMAQLEAMTEEERQVRDDFNAEHGPHIPADICLCIENPPTRWEVVPWAGDMREVLPEIDSDILAQAREKLAGGEGALPGSDSV
ncbi:autophagy protein Apg17-domain-containing protein [Melanogaster broomeanus]|nr:autophagy protein Apg17-domain-containing protein [Melanogaster broomeanus]